MKIGDIVYVLQDYILFKGEVLSIGKKNIKVKIPAQGWWTEDIKYVSPDKVAGENEFIAVIWETWKGKNGRGGYRLERNLYPNERKVAKNWPYKKYLDEEVKGTLRAAPAPYTGPRFDF